MAKGAKTGGREKGTPNKASGEIRSLMSVIVNKEIEKLPRHLSMIDPEKRLNILIKLLPYVVPMYIDKKEDVLKDSSFNFFQAINDSLKEKNANTE
jgi:hypothetical protein